MKSYYENPKPEELSCAAGYPLLPNNGIRLCTVHPCPRCDLVRLEWMEQDMEAERQRFDVRGVR